MQEGLVEFYYTTM